MTHYEKTPCSRCGLNAERVFNLFVANFRGRELPRPPVYHFPTMPDPRLLECFENPQPDRPYVIEHRAAEFTSLCPRTGQPDFGAITLRFSPNRLCVELKSLKLYLQSFRNEGSFYEAVTNRIRDDLAAAMQPRWLQITADFAGRGGITSRVTAQMGEVPGPYIQPL